LTKGNTAVTSRMARSGRGAFRAGHPSAVSGRGPVSGL